MMKKISTIILFVISIMLCNCEPVTISVSAEATAYAEVKVTVEMPGNNDNHNGDTINGPYVIFHGYVCSIKDTQLTEPVTGAQIRIVGSDSPECCIYTNEQGEFDVCMPITPTQNGEILAFAIEVQKQGFVTYSLYEICKIKKCWQLLGVDNPENYYMASCVYLNYGWDIIGKVVKCTVPIVKK